MTKQELLTQPAWNYQDIMNYLRCKKSKAYEVMSRCRKYYNGTIPFEKSLVTRDSVLSYLRTSIERELYIGKEVYEEELQTRKLS